MARKSRRRSRRRGHSIRRSRRGAAGKGSFLSRIVNTITKRPLKVISITLGIAAAATPFVEPDSNGNSVVSTIISIAQNPQNINPQSISGIPNQLINGVMKGNWVYPAIGAAITGIVSRKFKV